MGKIRIIAGTNRGRNIILDDKLSKQCIELRPTANRVRETLFNWLGQDLSHKSCLDLCAGSGALGFEAISRASPYVVMIEKNPQIYATLIKNQQILGINQQVATKLRIINQSAEQFLNNNHEKFSVIFLDPPFKSELLIQLLPLAIKALTADGMIYLEQQNCKQEIGKALNLDNFIIHRTAYAGMVNFSLIYPKTAIKE